MWWFAPGFGAPQESIKRSLDCFPHVLPLDQPQPGGGGGGRRGEDMAPPRVSQYFQHYHDEP